MPDIELTRPPLAGGEHILSEEALAFVADLQRRFGARREIGRASCRERVYSSV